MSNLSVAQGANPPGTGATITFRAPILPIAQTTTSPITLSVRATNKAGVLSAPRLVNLTIRPVAAPTVTIPTAVTLFSGATGSIALSGTDPNTPASLPLRFTVTQSGTPALTGLSVTQGANPPGTGATVRFTAPVLPLGRVTNDVITLTIIATNLGGKPSAPRDHEGHRQAAA